MKTGLSSRHQGLLQRAEQERAAFTEAAAALQKPLRWLDRVSPWLVLGFKLARAWRRRKI